MANKNVFSSVGTVPATNAVNDAGGQAYKLNPRVQLAQLACTNCFNGTFYASAEDNLQRAIDAVNALKNDPIFIAKTAVYARHSGYMKDMPAFLMVMLANINTNLFRHLFPRVIDNGKMLRNFCQIARSGATGRKFNLSAGTVRKAINDWFVRQSDEQLFNAIVGNDPSMKDIIRMAHPKPQSESRAALLAYLCEMQINEGWLTSCSKDGEIHRKHPVVNLPEIVQQYEHFKQTKTGKVPYVDFRLLDSLGLTTAQWTQVALNAGWTMKRMNLNTFARHGVLADPKVAEAIAQSLADPNTVKKARAFPYQLLAAWIATNANDKVPYVIKEALQDAMEIAIDNVPVLPGRTAICVDVSGSMGNAISGERKGATSAVTCVQVAGLIASSILRQNRDAIVVPFDSQVYDIKLNGRDTVLTNTQKLSINGGATDCSSALVYLNNIQALADTVIFVSDYESWIDHKGHNVGNWSTKRGTSMMDEWQKFKKRNQHAKLVCIDLIPNTSAQIIERPDILQVGGFSDQVFEVIKSFKECGHNSNHWVDVINQIRID